MQALWHRLSPNDLYKKSYHGLYCSACEDFYRQTELFRGRCPEHGTAPSQVNEENYFFRVSSYQRQIEQLIVEEKIDIIPPKRRNEVLSFIRRGLRDISISRDARRSRGWGVPVPTDASQIIYVWIDALTNYLSGQGLGDGDGWENVWNLDTNKIHVIGQNVWKFHATYWPALLLSAKLTLPNVIVVHGFLTADGKKIGKSLGNSVNPFECIDQFGNDAVRYYRLRATPAFDDGDFSSKRLTGLYETELANGLGNKLGRLSALCERVGTTSFTPPESPPAPAGFVERLESYQFDRAAAIAWDEIGQLNRSIESVKPWALLQANQRLELRGHLHHWLNQLYCLGHWLQPLIPDASSKITDNLTQPNIRHAEPLFPRLR